MYSGEYELDAAELSLESLRDLERPPLNTPLARGGLYFDATGQHALAHVAGARDVLQPAPLDSRLFDGMNGPNPPPPDLPDTPFRGCGQRRFVAQAAYHGRTQ